MTWLIDARQKHIIYLHLVMLKAPESKLNFSINWSKSFLLSMSCKLKYYRRLSVTFNPNENSALCEGQREIIFDPVKKSSALCQLLFRIFINQTQFAFSFGRHALTVVVKVPIRDTALRWRNQFAHISSHFGSIWLDLKDEFWKYFEYKWPNRQNIG